MSALLTLGRRSAVLGATTAASIDDVLASKDSLRRGNQGDAVSHVQRFLGIPEDGKFGHDTEVAVAAIQDAHVTGPLERGVVNAATYRAIMAYGPGPGGVAPASPSLSRPGTAPPVADAPASDAPGTSPVPTWKKVVFAVAAGGIVAGGALLLRRNK